MTSSINPNNIDGAYPVAGQDNNSQGFRDNFTNTKTNFGYAAAEITDLQNKAVLKSALTGTTLNNDMNASILSNFQGQNISGTVVSLGTISGDVGINYAAGPYQTVTTGGPISLAFTNFTAAGTQDTVYVQVTISNVADTLTFPSAVGTGASATSLIGIQGLDTGTNTITFAATGTYVYSFTTTDSGTTIYLNDLTQARVGFSGNVSVVGNLSVTGTITGNIEITNIESIVGNVTAGNLRTGGQVTATGNVTGGNILTAGLISATGNITVGNISTAGLLNATANVTGGNLRTSGVVSATGNITGANLITTANAIIGTDLYVGSGANATAFTNPVIVGRDTGLTYIQAALVNTSGNGSADFVAYGNNGTDTQGWMDLGFTGNTFNDPAYTVTGANDGYLFAQGNASFGGNLVIATGNTGTTKDIVFATGGFLSGNIKARLSNATGAFSVTGNVLGGNITTSAALTRAKDVEIVAYANITSTNTYSLSTTSSINVLIANNTGYTATLNMPTTPVDGQICNFAISGNTVTLATGTGTVLPSYAGSTTAGTGFRYIYRSADTSWYRIG